MALRKIRIRRHNDLSLHASLHGINMPMMKVQSEKEEKPMNPVEDEKIQALLQAAIEAKRQEMSSGT